MLLKKRSTVRNTLGISSKKNGKVVTCNKK